jgi:hypothetical protein
MAQDLVEDSVREFAVELLGPRVCVLPVEVAPCSDLNIYLLGHCFRLGGVRDHCVDFSCGALAKLEEYRCVRFKLDAIEEISKGELSNGLLVCCVLQIS